MSTRILLSLAPQPWDLVHTSTPGFSRGSWRSNPGPHACMEDVCGMGLLLRLSLFYGIWSCQAETIATGSRGVRCASPTLGVQGRRGSISSALTELAPAIPRSDRPIKFTYLAKSFKHWSQACLSVLGVRHVIMNIINNIISWPRGPAFL